MVCRQVAGAEHLLLLQLPLFKLNYEAIVHIRELNNL